MLSPFVLLILFSLSVDLLLINVKKSCVPLQIAKGPCHKCVCNIEGIFKCQSTECQNQTLDNSVKLNNKGECQPLMTYQYEDLYCTCSYEGKWMSYNCRAYFQNIMLDDNNIHNKNLRINFVSDNQLPKGDIEPIKEGDSCVPGKVYKVSCNTCQCVPNNALICTKMLCLDSTIQQKIESLKNTRNKTIEFNRRNVPDGTYNKLKSLTEIVPPKECVPGKLYRNGCHKCLCRHNQVFTCTKKCHSSLQNRISDYEISQLETRSISDIPRLPHVGTECEPGRTYAVSCNLCYCSDMRDLVCTLKYCLNISSYAVIQANKLTGTPCTKDYIKQCAKCQCVDGKSVCTGLKTCFSDIGGKQLLSSAGNKVKLSLDATRDKCVPHAAYKVHCNDCFCQPDGSLRCTQKTCLTHSQAKELNERQTYLVKHGL